MRSIDLAWLSRQDKDIRLPQLLFRASPAGGAGCCYSPDEAPLELEGEVIDCRTGIIVVDPDIDVPVDATLAHEWRHLWQAYNAPIKSTIQWQEVSTFDEYRAAIIRFFQQPHEADALRHELRRAPSELNMEWAGWLEWSVRRQTFSFPHHDYHNLQFLQRIQFTSVDLSRLTWPPAEGGGSPFQILSAGL